MSEPTSHAARDTVLDATKGIAILAVVTFHTTRGLVGAGMIDNGPALNFADTVAYGFHIEIFLIIAGYFAYPSARSPGYQLRRQSWLYHAYLFWSLASWCISWLMAGAVNHPVSIHDLLSIPYNPYQQYWLLMALMQGTLLLAFLRSGTALLAGCAALIALFPFLRTGASLLVPHSGIIFFLIGAWLRAAGLRPAVSLPAALACFAALAAGAWSSIHLGLGFYPPLYLVHQLCGCYAAYALAAWLVRVPAISAVLTTFGRQSLAIYLTHVLACAATRIAIARLLPDMPMALAAAIIIAVGLSSGLIFARLAAITGTRTLFALQPFVAGPVRPARAVPA